jgi:DNA helicase II / ATP-dependent DNA helicase PcrA
MHYLDELNHAQKEAVLSIDGPMMVIAGAGSGKTRVLTYRIAHLIELGVDPFSILSLTFTNKAAKEMKERIGKIIGDDESRNIWMGTFHSVFSRILRIECEKINYPRNFTIYDTADSKSLVKTVIKEMRLDDKVYKPGVVYNRISSAKNNLISPKAYAEDPEITSEDKMAGRPRLAEIYATYKNRCFRAGAMDFDDLLFNTNVLLRDHPDVLHKYQHRFRYILVDEYQDTNFSQYLIIKKLAAAHENVCVVGDDAQSIYAFRGANIQNILNFKQDYPGFKIFKLEQNYRSTKVIVNAANSIIDKNKDQIKKTVWTDNPDGTPIIVHKASSDNDEGQFVSSRIFDLKNQFKATHKDFAILYRTNAQSRAFEEALRKINLPYRIYGGLSFYQRKEIKDLLAYFRLTANPQDEEAFKRIVNYPARGIGKTSLEKLFIAANDADLSLWETIEKSNEVQTDLGNAALGKLREFTTTIKSFQALIQSQSAYDIGQHIATTSGLLRDLYQDKSPEGVARYENIQELLEFSDSGEGSGKNGIRTLADFLLDVALLTDADNDDGDDDKIALMTIHSAKGLEFPYVFIVGMEENLFPSQMAMNSREELEEERRLFYVAITRAEKEACLSYATTRYRWGNLIFADVSRFIDEIDESYLDRKDLLVGKRLKSFNDDFSSARKGFNSIPTPGSVKGLFNELKPSSEAPAAPKVTGSIANPTEIIVGMEVIHSRFGKGKVLSIEGVGENSKATVFFPSAGQKQLLLKFAKLELA